MGEELKLSYISNMFRVKLSLPHRVCLESPEVPPDLFDRARAKLEQVKNEGAIEVFEVYTETLKSVWERYRNLAAPPTPDLNFTIGEGSPKLKGFEVKPPTDSKSVALLTINSDSNYLRLLRLEWLVLYVNHFLDSLGQKERAHPAHIHRAWLKAINGALVRDLSIGPKPTLAPGENAKPFSIYSHASGEITIVIRDLNVSLEGREPSFLIRAVQEASKKVKLRTDEIFQILEREVLSTIQSALEGPEIIGIRLPIVMLGGLPLKNATDLSAPSYPGAGKLNIKVSRDKLLASVENFDMKIYSDTNFVANEEWLKRELKRYGLSKAATQENFDNLLTALLAQGSLEGMIAAEGVEAFGGSSPFLELCFEQKQSSKNDTADTVDMRSMHQINFVKKGQLIAKISYDTPSIIGRDVYGHPIVIQATDPFPIKLGDGVSEREPGRYFAETDGIPIIEDNSISLNKVMVHHGDVNLRSGNISFDGPVEIFGSIDSGALVETTGDLRVRGTVRGAIVKSKGDITVEGGIVTGKSGMVSTAKNLKAEFIENSHIQCGGSITVRRVIINSDVIAGGNIEITDNFVGLVAGGNISCRRNIKSANIGFKNGAVTILNVGVDWKAELATLICKKRLDKIKEAMLNDRQIVRELTSRKQSQLNEKQQHRKDHFQRRLVKERQIIERLQDKLRLLQTQQVYNYESKILISNKICTNVDINIGGGPVQLKQDLISVAILGKRRLGTKIVSYEVGLQLSEREDD